MDMLTLVVCMLVAIGKTQSLIYLRYVDCRTDVCVFDQWLDGCYLLAPALNIQDETTGCLLIGSRALTTFPLKINDLVYSAWQVS